MYAVAREASGRGFESVPAKRISLDPQRLGKLALGIDADYDYKGMFPWPQLSMTCAPHRLKVILREEPFDSRTSV